MTRVDSAQLQKASTNLSRKKVGAQTRCVTKSKMIAYSGVFTAAYLLAVYTTSLIVGPQLRGVEAHLIRAFLFALIAVRVKSFGGPTLMGSISGILLITIPAHQQFFSFQHHS